MVFCVELGRSLGFCPYSLEMRAGGEGARPALGFSPGCERGDNRRREPSSASTARSPGASGRWSRTALGTPSVGGGRATEPSAATPGLRVRVVFLAGVGGQTAARCQPERGGATPEDRWPRPFCRCPRARAPERGEVRGDSKRRGEPRGGARGRSVGRVLIGPGRQPARLGQDHAHAV